MAGHLHQSPEWVVRNHTDRGIAWWMAYDRISPIGPLREDIRAGSICQLVAALSGAKEIGPLADYMLKYDLGGYDEDGTAAPKPGERYITAEERLQFTAAMIRAEKRVRARKAEKAEKEAAERRERAAEKAAAKLAAKQAKAAERAAEKAAAKQRRG